MESMASAAGEGFGEHRQLNRDGAAKELVIRWNGPALWNDDRLIGRVQQRPSSTDTFISTRRTVSIAQSFEATVISRHRTSGSKARLWNVVEQYVQIQGYFSIRLREKQIA